MDASGWALAPAKKKSQKLWLDLEFCEEAAREKFSRFGKRADDIPAARKSQWLSGRAI
jgi:hypothetical protein